ncbi:colicin V synthesis protein, partial [Salmonella enterica subsp. enterica serovar Oslo]|nr:colicin V synthesis protein [Salmonella enterica subsp. enterica serovar Oslo]
SFTGVALEIWPDCQFKEEKVKKRINITTLINNINGIKGILLKIFSLSILIEAIGLLLPIGTQVVMDHAIPASDRGLLTLVCIGLMFFISLRMILSSIRAWISLIMSALINSQWQSGLFYHLLNLPLEYYERRKLGDIQSRFNSLVT